MTESTTTEVRGATLADTPLNDRYALKKKLGRGGQGVTYLADDLETGKEVVVKELLLHQAVDWKSVELFQREGTSLKSLSHDGIPSYIDAFADGSEDRFFLVQEYVDGKNFDQLLAGEVQFSEEEARTFLDQMLEILEYIHGQQPPVIHRDIKPSNIIRRQSDDRLVLIDFGAAQACITDDEGASTVIGTTGYMPIEQLSGRAVPATDLYALGATTVHLLSRRHPADLPIEHLTLQFQDYVNISTDLSKFLKKLLAPHVEDRFASAQSARQALSHLESPTLLSGPQVARKPNRGRKKPKHSGIDLLLSITMGILIIPAMAGVFISSSISNDFNSFAGLMCSLPLVLMIVIGVILYARSKRRSREARK